MRDQWYSPIDLDAPQSVVFGPGLNHPSGSLRASARSRPRRSVHRSGRSHRPCLVLLVLREEERGTCCRRAIRAARAVSSHKGVDGERIELVSRPLDGGWIASRAPSAPCTPGDATPCRECACPCCTAGATAWSAPGLPGLSATAFAFSTKCFPADWV